MPKCYGLQVLSAAPATGLLGAANMSAGVLFRQSAAESSNVQLWGNNAANAGWGIRLQADTTAPTTQLFNLLSGADATAFGRSGATAPEMLGANNLVLVSFSLAAGALRCYINGQLAATAALDAPAVVGAAPPVLTGGTNSTIVSAFYTETVLDDTAMAALGIAAANNGDIYSGIAAQAPNAITALSIQHAYSARQGQRPVGAAWADVGTLANRPLVVTTGTNTPNPVIFNAALV